MDPKTLGAQLKAKYPQYAQYPDEMLGRRWIEKNVKKPAVVAPVGNPYAFLEQNKVGTTPDPSAFSTPVAAPQPKPVTVQIQGLAGNGGNGSNVLTTQPQPQQQAPQMQPWDNRSSFDPTKIRF